VDGERGEARGAGSEGQRRSIGRDAARDGECCSRDTNRDRSRFSD